MRCSATTKLGKQYSATSRSNWADDRGNLIGGPLQNGSDFCLLHAKPFSTKPTQIDVDLMVVFLIDLETTGVDIVRYY